MRLVELLATEIGVRTAGSEGAARAASAIAESFRELGLRPSYQEFSLLGYDPDEPQLEIEGERWPVAPCMYSHPTPDGGVEGFPRHIGTHVIIPRLFEPLAFALEDVRGRELARLYANPLGGGAVPFPSGYGPLTTGPAAYISTADGERLRTLDGVHARLRTGGRFVPGRKDRNVIAELPGDSEEAVLVVAHFDSVWRGPGAVDNASGVEGMRRVVQRLGTHRRARRVLFCAFAAEEAFLSGARFFVAEAKTRGKLDRILGVVNLDCIGRSEHVLLRVGPDQLRERALALAQERGFTERYAVRTDAPGPGSDDFPFSQEGIPTVGILHWPYPEYHLPQDLPHLVDEQRLEDSVELAAALVESQLVHPVARGA